MSAFAQRALIGGVPYPLWPFGPSPPDRGSRPPSPRLRETPSWEIGTFIRRASSSQSPLYSGRPSVGIRHAAPLLLLSPPNPLRWALAGTPIMSGWPFLPRGHRPLLSGNLKVSVLYGHRLLWQNRGSWSVAARERSARRSPPHQTGRQAPGGVR